MESILWALDLIATVALSFWALKQDTAAPKSWRERKKDADNA